MPMRSTSHFTWQVLRTVKRTKKPPTGLVLRLIRNSKTKDGSFLTDLVNEGLLTRVTGSADAPFDATYSLTEKGQHAAEYGEYQYELKRNMVGAQPRNESPVAKGRTR